MLVRKLNNKRYTVKDRILSYTVKDRIPSYTVTDRIPRYTVKDTQLQRRLRLENPEFSASLDNIGRPCLKTARAILRRKE